MGHLGKYIAILLQANWRSYFAVGLFLLVACLFFIPALNRCLSGQKINTWSDAEGYYMYLPALFIYDGFEQLPILTEAQFQRNESTGKVYNKYTYGVAILELPFFLASHLISLSFDSLESDGYQSIYQCGVLLAAIFCTMTGLWLLYRQLRLSGYSGQISFLTIFALYFGTNLLHYSTAEPGMSHAYSFFLFALLIALIPKFYRNPSINKALAMSLVIGLIVFIRPTNILMALFILFSGVVSIPEWKSRIGFILRNLSIYAILPLPFIILFGFQIYLWSEMAGEWTLYSYSGEPGFIFWDRPKVMKVLFSVQNGLFVYSPVLLFCLPGLAKGILKNRTNFLLIGLILILATYIFSSWWAWWFGGAYGHRSYVEYLALLAFPLAYFFQWVVSQRMIALKILVIFVTCFFVFYSIRMTSLYAPPWDGEQWGWDAYFMIVKKAFFVG